jgi:hypothetical protein
MTESTKMKIYQQAGGMLVSHMIAAVVAFIFGMTAFWWFLAQPVWKELFSVIFAGVYTGFIYVKAKKYAVYDKKPYTENQANLLKGLLFGAVLAGVTLLLWFFYWIGWTYFSSGDGLSGIVSMFFNFLFMVWTFPLNGIMGADHGVLRLVGVVLMYVLPVVGSVAGYLAGYFKFNLMEKLQGMMYEKN